ncbi:hypothetical protein [Glaciihabitans sp. UYNi722]|uniref:hypothetical protein n=1 Tax=Glaciihabitans sp. UYNi722 TaxID=3156344 RepID=UPI0033924E40
MSDAGKRTREVSPAEYEELQELVYELVRERLTAAIGVGGMWSIDFRKPTDNNAVFSETVAERLAWDVAAHIAPHQPVANVHSAQPVDEIIEESVDTESILVAEYVAPPEWARFAPPTTKPVEMDPPAAEIDEHHSQHSSEQLVA